MMAATTHIRTVATPGESRGEADVEPTPASRRNDNRIEAHALAAAKSAQSRHDLIAQAAFYRAQQRCFIGGEDWQDWFAAEREIDGLLDPDL